EPCTHHEGVLHSDNGTVQYGGGHRGDLKHLALPALALPLLERFSSQVRHQLLDLPALSLGKEGLCLVQRCFGHHDAGRAVFHLGKDLDGLAWERGEKRSAIHFKTLMNYRKAAAPTSRRGVLMSMCSNTMNSFLTFTGSSQGRCSSAFTQYLTLPCFPSNEVARALQERGERSSEI
ncbi:hypothetical protein GOODEAATRI_007492, partial [Goodea atripinnis]